MCRRRRLRCLNRTLADVGACGCEPLAYVVEVGAGGDGDAVVVDGTAASWLGAVPDDRVCCLLGDVERASAAEVEDDHARMGLCGCHLEGDPGIEDVLVEGDDAVEAGGDGGDVVESGGSCHCRSAGVNGLGAGLA
jgi:hypothetical protein